MHSLHLLSHRLAEGFASALVIISCPLTLFHGLFDSEHKKRPYWVNLLEKYRGSLQLEAEGSPTPDTKLCPLSYPFPVAQR